MVMMWNGALLYDADTAMYRSTSVVRFRLPATPHQPSCGFEPVIPDSPTTFFFSTATQVFSDNNTTFA
jgi:hypothetical protein